MVDDSTRAYLAAGDGLSISLVQTPTGQAGFMVKLNKEQESSCSSGGCSGC